MNIWSYVWQFLPLDSTDLVLMIGKKWKRKIAKQNYPAKWEAFLKYLSDVGHDLPAALPQLKIYIIDYTTQALNFLWIDVSPYIGPYINKEWFMLIIAGNWMSWAYWEERHEQLSQSWAKLQEQLSQNWEKVQNEGLSPYWEKLQEWLAFFWEKLQVWFAFLWEKLQVWLSQYWEKLQNEGLPFARENMISENEYIMTFLYYLMPTLVTITIAWLILSSMWMVLRVLAKKFNKWWKRLIFRMTYLINVSILLWIQLIILYVPAYETQFSMWMFIILLYVTTAIFFFYIVTELIFRLVIFSLAPQEYKTWRRLFVLCTSLFFYTTVCCFMIDSYHFECHFLKQFRVEAVNYWYVFGHTFPSTEKLPMSKWNLRRIAYTGAYVTTFGHHFPYLTLNASCYLAHMTHTFPSISLLDRFVIPNSERLFYYTIVRYFVKGVFTILLFNMQYKIIKRSVRTYHPVYKTRYMRLGMLYTTMLYMQTLGWSINAFFVFLLCSWFLYWTVGLREAFDDRIDHQ